jgi:hypothetical protein
MVGVRIRIRRRILPRVLISFREGWILRRVVEVALIDFSVPSAGATFTPACPGLPLGLGSLASGLGGLASGLGGLAAFG